MELFFSSILSYLLLYKYTTLFTVSFLAAFLLPVPSSSLLAASGAFAAQGYFSLIPVLVVAFLGNIVGDMVGYIIAWRYGEEFLRKIGFKKIIDAKAFVKLEHYMSRFSYPIIFFSRFLTTIGPTVNIVSGITKLRIKKFLPIAIVGEISFVLLYGLVGYYLGSSWENNLEFLVEIGLVILVIGILMTLIHHHLRKLLKDKKSVI